MFSQILRLFLKYFPINWNFLAPFSNKRVENCFIYLVVAPTACVFSWKRHSFLFQRSCNFCLFFSHEERVFFGMPYFVATSLFVIPFSKPLKLYIYTYRLIISPLFYGHHFSLSKNQKLFVWIHNVLFMFSIIECMIRKRLNVRIRAKKFEFHWKRSER